MPKLKTRKAAAKRFKVTSTGKILRRGAMTKHLLEWKQPNFPVPRLPIAHFG